jgi:5,10-methylenetetrahydromethanopterin reductase
VTNWGVWLHAVRPVAELAGLAAAAEALGARAVLVADEGTDRDLYVTLAALAQRTTRVLLVGAVTNPHSRHPVATAAAWASVAELAPGRVVAGFGAGGSRVFGPFGLQPAKPYKALVECIDVVDALLAGQTVDHNGEFLVRAATLPWSPGRLPVALAGRGPRVERLAAERADWILLAGRAIERVGPLVADLRAIGEAQRGQAAAIAWNPSLGWTEPLIDEIRSHLAYMVVDMPATERTALGIDDNHTAQIREVVNSRGATFAGPLIPDAVLERYAVTGSRPRVVARLAELCRQVQPELVLFEAGDYSVPFLAAAAALAVDAGITPFHSEAEHGLDPHD